MIDEQGYHYGLVDVQVDRATRIATFTVKAPAAAIESTPDAIVAAGANWWPLKFAARTRRRHPQPAHQRAGDRHLGHQDPRRRGNLVMLAWTRVLSSTRPLAGARNLGALRRTLARLDVTSRSLIALVDEGSCFAGTFYELALACDRIYMLDLPDAPDSAPALRLNAANFGRFPEVNGLTRLQTRFNEDRHHRFPSCNGLQDSPLRADQALGLGLVTLTPDDIDWDDEIRIMLEERASLSPDALTGMEASLRFPGKETMETRVFGRLSAWQNWIFIRPNAVGKTVR
jgi:benzoyl-CoA-dihydrodiol lyase